MNLWLISWCILFLAYISQYSRIRKMRNDYAQFLRFLIDELDKLGVHVEVNIK